MLFAPIASKRTRGLTATVVDMGTAPSTTPGYNFWGFEIDNTANAATTYIQIFNLPASQVTLGTTVADLVYAVSASAARGFGFGPFLIFDKGLSAAATTTKDGNVAPGTAIDVTLYFEGK